MMQFQVDAVEQGEGAQITVRASDGASKSYAIAGGDQQHYADFFAALARDFGTRLPDIAGDASEYPSGGAKWTPLLTENISPTILCGYGDPAVLKTGDGYYLVATSNDAPDAFPILHSNDLEHWQHRGFAFPKGNSRRGPLTGRRVADFWAPEMAKVGDEYWLVLSPPGSRRTRSPSASPRAAIRPVRGPTSAGRC